MVITALGDINADSGLNKLNEYLKDKSYIDGFTPSQSDVALFGAFAQNAAKTLNDKHAHVKRWLNQISSYSAGEQAKLPGVKKSLSDFGVTSTPGGAKAGGKAKAATPDADDDFELFGSDEEGDAEAEKQREERLKAYAEKKAKKPGPIAKSNVILDVKPWDDETDMKKMEESVRTIQCEGLVWGVSKLVPLAYGIKKLTIVCVVEDEKVSIDWLTEEIEKFEDLVQSVDIAAFQKI